MEHDDGLSAKLWLEEFEVGAEAADEPQYVMTYQTKKFNFTKKQVQSIQQFLKKNKSKWETLIHAAWGLLFARCGTTDSIIYGTADLLSSQAKKLKISQPITPILTNINDKISIRKYISKIKTQLQKKITKKNKEIDVRYLLLAKKIKKNIKTMPIKTNQFPLILVVDKNQYSYIEIFYKKSLFSKSSIKSLLEHIALILEAICNDPKEIVTQFNILTDNEKQKLFQLWNKPQYPFAVPELTSCPHELFAKQALKTPDQLAIDHENTLITYQELEKVSTYFARMLLSYGVRPGDRVAVLMDRTPTLIMIMLAIFKTGAIYVPIEPKYPDERIKYVLEDSEPAIVLVNETQRLSKDNLAISHVIESNWNLLDYQQDENKDLVLPTVTPETIAYIIYTSGTTGQPKGVMIKHASLTNLIVWYWMCFSATAKDRASQFASQGFDAFFCETIPMLATGASIHIVDDNTKLSPSLFFDWLVNKKITICDLPTAYAQMLFSMSWPQDLNLRILKIGGESLTHYPNHKFPFDIWNIYGPTETTIEATYAKIYTANTAKKTSTEKHPPPIGKPIANSEVYIVDQYLQPVPLGVAGELLIGGIVTSTGYFHRGELTEEKFIPHILAKNKNKKLYRTGDLARWTLDGNLEFIGRVDYQVKIRGYRIELSEIETIVSQYPDVNEVVVIAKEAPHGEKTLIAYIVPDLDKQRFLYQERCLLSINHTSYIEVLVEDISTEGVKISGLMERVTPGQNVTLLLKLPGFTESKKFPGYIIWQENNHCGIKFNLKNEDEKEAISKSIDYFLTTHNVMEVLLSSSTKRSLRKALRKKLPEYMIPFMFVTLLKFPLTFSGKIDVKGLPPPEDFEHLLQKEYIPPKTETEKILATLWGEILQQKQISMSDNFFDLGANSLSAAKLSVKILEHFKLSMPAKILFDLPFIPILAQYIDSKGRQYTTQSIIQAEIQHDSRLPENILPTKKISPSLKNPQNILLTGAGGFLGIYLLKELLAHTQAKIYCLIRKGEFETAAKRLIATIESFKLENEISLSDRRIIAIPSDLSFDRLGIPLELYNNLTEKIDLICHCGAQVNIMAAYNKLRGSNVYGTLEMIKLATTHHDKPIHYISTLSATCKKDVTGSLMEEFPGEQYGELTGGYALSKWVSEKLLTEIKNRGLPVSIYRSGYISGRSDTGMTNPNDALLMLIKGCIQLGLAPDWEEKITILPVDFVSKAIIRISLHQPDTAAVYHIDHPTGILWSDLISWLNNYGYIIKFCSLRKWQQQLAKINSENALFPFLPYYLSLPEKQTSPLVNTEKATEILKSLELPYPAIDDNLLNTYFNYLREIDFMPATEETSVQKTDS